MIKVTDKANKKALKWFFNSDIDKAIKYSKTLSMPVLKRVERK